MIGKKIEKVYFSKKIHKLTLTILAPMAVFQEWFPKLYNKIDNVEGCGLFQGGKLKPRFRGV